MSSLFSKIIAREIPARIVYENEQVIAFLDINPVNPGHTLVVPKNEQTDVTLSSEEDINEVFKVIRLLAPVIVSTVGAQGFNVVTNTGEAAGQSVFHTHFHIIPRFAGDGHMPWEHVKMSDEEFDQVKTKIQMQLHEV